MTKKIIDDYFAKNYNKILEISKNIQNKRLKDSECEYDTLVISCYEYCVTHIDGLPDNIESVVVNWMYKQVIWYGTKFKKEFVYRKDVPFSSMDDNIDRDFDVEEELDDIDDVLKNELDIQEKMSIVLANKHDLDPIDLRLYHLVFNLGYDNSGKISRLTGIPRTGSWMLIRDLKEKLRKGYDK